MSGKLVEKPKLAEGKRGGFNRGDAGIKADVTTSVDVKLDKKAQKKAELAAKKAALAVRPRAAHLLVASRESFASQQMG